MKKSEINNKNEYISLQKAAEIYNCTQKHMNLLARQGRLKAVKLGRNWFTTREWLKDYKNELNTSNNASEKYISLGEAAKVYGCTPRHLSLMARQGKLKAVRIGRSWFTTFKWLREYLESVKGEKIILGKFPPVVPILSAKKVFAVSLIGFLIFCFVSIIFVGWKENTLPASSTVKEVVSAYTSTLELTKDSFESLVFNSANFVKGSYIKIINNNVKGLNESPARAILETTKILSYVINSNFGQDINKMASILVPVEKVTFDFAEKFTALHRKINKQVDKMVWEPLSPYTQAIGKGFIGTWTLVKYTPKAIGHLFAKVFNGFIAFLDAIFGKSGYFVINKVSKAIIFVDKFFSSTKNTFVQLSRGLKSLITFDFLVLPYPTGPSDQTFISIKDLYRRLADMREYMEGRKIVIIQTTQEIIKEITITKPVEVRKEVSIIKEQAELDAFKKDILAMVNAQLADMETTIVSNEIIQNNYYYSEAAKAGGFNVSNTEVDFNENVDMNKNLTVLGTVTGGTLTDGTLTITGGNISGGNTLSFSRASLSSDFEVGSGLFYINVGSQSYQFGGTGTASFTGPVEITEDLEVASANFNNLEANTFTDNYLSINSGNISNGQSLSFIHASISDDITVGNLLSNDYISVPHASISDDLTVSDVFTARDGIVSISDDFYVGNDMLWSSITNDTLYSSSSWQTVGNWNLDGTASISDDFYVGGDSLFFDLSADYFYSSSSWLLTGNWDLDGTASVSSNLNVYGNALFDKDASASGDFEIGDATSDLLIVNSYVASDLTPNDNSRSLGTTNNRWRYGYIDELTVATISATGTDVGGTTNAAFIINSDNETNDAEDSFLTFERGTPVTNASLKWDSGNIRFDLNFPLNIQEALIVADQAQFGGTATADYSRFGTNTTGHSLSATSDLLISGLLEVDGGTYFDSGVSQSLDIAGTASISDDIWIGDDLTISDYLSFNRASASDSLTVSDILRGGTITDGAAILTGGAFTGLSSLTSTTGTFTHASISDDLTINNFLTIYDDKILELGNDADFRLTYDETTNDRLELSDGTNDFLTIKDLGTTASISFSGNAYVSNLFGIGETDPNYNLAVDGTASISDDFYVGGDDVVFQPFTDQTDSFVVASSGYVQGDDYAILSVDTTNERVGIGTTAPAALLEVQNLTSQAKIFLTSNNAGAQIKLNKMNSGGQYFYVETGAANMNALSFHRNISPYADLLIDSSGNVGIGTTSPDSLLDVAGQITASSSYINGLFTGVHASLSDDLTIGDNITFTDSTASISSALVLDGILDSNGTASSTFAGDLDIEGDVNIGGGDLYVDASSGNVGIGTTGPANKLHVVGATPSGAAAAGSTDYIVIDSSGGGYINFREPTGATGNQGIIFSDDTRAVGYLAYNHSDNSMILRAGGGDRVVIQSDGDLIVSPGKVGIGDTSPDFGLEVAASSSTNGWFAITSDEGGSLDGDIFVVDENKNIGIGDTNPSHKLSVDGTASISDDFYVTGDDVIFQPFTNQTDSFIIASSGWVAGENPIFNVDTTNQRVGIGTTSPGAKLSFGMNVDAQTILLYHNANTRYGFGIQSNELRQFFPSDAGFISFGTINTSDGNTFSEKMRITKDGNVGIGDSVPGYTLSVDGTASVSDDFYVGNNMLFADLSANEIYSSAAWDISGNLEFDNLTVTHASISDDLSVVNNIHVSSGILDIDGTASSTFAGDLDIEGDVNVGGGDLYVDASSGRVGIGTTSPGALLHLYQGASGLSWSNAGFFMESNTHQYLSFLSTANTQQGIIWGAGGTNEASVLFEDGSRGNYLYINPANYLGIAAGTSVGSNYQSTAPPSNGMIIEGNVGIGTTSPDAKLDVAGQIISSSSWTYHASVSDDFETLSAQITSASFGTIRGGTWNGSPIDISDYTNLGATNPLSLVGDTLYIDYASSSGGGYLTSSDWTTFNNKLTASVSTDFEVGTGLFYVNVGSSSYQFGGTGTASFVGPVNISQDLDVSEGDLFVDDSSGYVGIGTTGPGTTLEVYRAAGGVNALFGGGGTSGLIYISGDTIGTGYNANSNDNMWINYGGYQDGTTQFRDLQIGDGKGNTIAMFDGSTGNVGIGTVAPSTELSIVGTASISQDLWASGSFQFGGGETTATASYSRLGSGTTGHSLADADDLLVTGLLEVDDNAFFDGNLTVEGTITGTGAVVSNSIDFDEIVDNATLDNNWVIGASNYYVSFPHVSASDDLSVVNNLHISSGIIDVDGTASSTFAGDLDIEGDVNVGGGDLRVDVSSGNVIIANGNVGIGTTGPNTKLELSGDASVSGGNSALRFSETSGQANSRNWVIGNASGPNYGNLSFYVSAAAGGNPLSGGTNVLELARTGLVGIGDTSPGYTLSVDGTASVSDDFYVGNNMLFADLSANEIYSSAGWDISGNLEFDNLTVTHASISDDLSVVNNIHVSSGILDIDGTASSTFAGDLDIEGDVNVGNGDLYVDAGTGNVGIGTTGPVTALDVVGRINVAPSGTTPDTVYNGNLVITKPTASAQYINLIRTGTYAWSLGTVYNTGTFAIGQSQATDSSFTAPEFVITTIGNVGIGTTSPDSLLNAQLSSDLSSGNVITFDSGTNIELTASGSDQYWLYVAPKINQTSTSSYVGFLMDVTETGTGSGTNELMALRVNGTDKFVIDNSGKVGILDSAPGYTLSVDGTASISDDFYVGGDDIIFQPFTNQTDSFVVASSGYVQGDDYAIFSVDSTNQRVGVGTTGPGAKLDISGGDIRLSNNRYIYFRNAADNADVAVLRISNGDDTYLSSGPSDQLLLQGHNNTELTTDAGRIDIKATQGATGAYIGFFTGGTSERVRIDSSGNVGIGNTAPGYKLEVAGDILASSSYMTAGFFASGSSEFDNVVSISNEFTVASGMDIGGGDLYVDATDGNVGIGTTGPGALLNINGSSSDTSTTNPYKQLILENSDNTNNNVIALSFSGLNSDNVRVNAAWIGSVLHDRGSGLISGDIFFTTRNGAGPGGTERLRITSTGNVGIGTTSPDYLLDVAGSIMASSSFSKYASISQDFEVGSGIFYVNTGSQSYQFGGTGTASFVGPVNISQDLDVSEGDLFVDDSSGYVGIGTTGPTSILHVYQAQPNVQIQASGTGNQAVLSLVNSVGTFRLGRDSSTGGDLFTGGGALANAAELGTRESTALQFFTSDVARVTIDTTGNVGIGDTSPDFGLEVAASSSTNGWFAITSDEAGSLDGDIFVVDENKNIGIGDTNPSYKLSVDGTASISDDFYVTGDDVIFQPFTNQTDSFIIASSGWVAGENPIFNVDTTNQRVGIGTTNPVRNLHIKSSGDAWIEVESTGGTTSAFLVGTDANNRFDIYDAKNSAYRLSINNAGNVGIGDISPDFGLEVAASSSTNGWFAITSDESGANDGDIFVVDENKRVGINDTNPSYYLSVDGTASVSDSFYAPIFYDTDNTSYYLNPDGSSLLNNLTVSGTLTADGIYASDSIDFDEIVDNATLDNNWVIGGDYYIQNNYSSISQELTIGDSDVSFLLGGIASISSTLWVGDEFTVASGMNIDSGTLYVDAYDNNVGIGTTGPGYALDVMSGNIHLAGADGWNGAGDRATLYIGDYGAGGRVGISSKYGGPNDLIFSVYKASAGGTLGTDSYDAMVIAQNTGDIGIGTTSPDSKLDVVGQIISSSSWTYHASVSDDFETLNAQITSASIGTLYTTNYNPSYVSVSQDFSVGDSIFYVNTGSQSYQFGGTGTASFVGPVNISQDLDVSEGDLFVDDSSGYVGIGTTWPADKVVVGASGVLTFENTVAAESYLSLFAGSGTGDKPAIGFKDQLRFGTVTGTGYAGWSEKVRIDNAGNIGIGTTSPDSKLDVVGQIISSSSWTYHASVSDDLTVGSDDISFIGGVGSISSTLWVGDEFTVASGMNIDSGTLYVDAYDNNVGIGTTGPGARLVTEATTNIFRMQESDGPVDEKIWGFEGSAGDLLMVTRNDADTTGSAFLTIKRTGVTVDSFNIGQGNVGIGDTVPGYTLSVDGTASISDDFYFGSSLLWGDVSANNIFSSASWNIDNIVSISSGLYVDTFTSISDDLSVASAGYVSGDDFGPTMYIDTPNDYIGIGTSNPQYPFHIYSKDNSVKYWTVQDDSSDERPRFQLLKTIDNGAPNAGDLTGIFSFSFKNSAGTIRTADISSRVSDPTSGTEDTQFRFTNRENGVGVDVLYIGGAGIGGGGYIGIKDTSPDFGMEIAASTSSGYLAVSSDDVDDGDLFLVDESGNVGIGDTAPSYKLSVDGTASISDVVYFGDEFTVASGMNIDSGTLYVDAYDNNVGIGTTGPQRTLSVGTKIGLDAGADNGNIYFSSQSGGISNQGAYIQGVESGTWGSRIDFYARDAAGSLMKNVMSISGEGSGNVGIGTTSPDSKLDVAGQIISSSSWTYHASVSDDFETLSAQITSASIGTLYNTTFSTTNFSTTHASVSDDLQVTNIASISDLTVTGDDVVFVPYTDQTDSFVIASSGYTAGDDKYLFQADTTNEMILINGNRAQNPGFYEAPNRALNVRFDDSGGVNVGLSVENQGGGKAGIMLQGDNGHGGRIIFAEYVTNQWKLESSGQNDANFSANIGFYRALDYDRTFASTSYFLLDGSGGGIAGIWDNTPDFGLEVASKSNNGYFGVTLSTDGDIFVVDESGNVGIGDTNPSYTLSVDGTASVSDSFYVQGATLFQPNTDSTTFFQIASSSRDGSDAIFTVDTTDQRVGIGTTSPGAKLHVSGGVIQIDHSTLAGFSIQNTVATFADAVTVGTAGNPNFYSNWDILTDTQDDATKQSWGIRLYSANGDKIEFKRAPAGGSFVNLMVLDSSGRLGIGDDTPLYTLSVDGTASISDVVFFGDEFTVASGMNIDSGTLYVDANDNNVGIGTTEPGRQVHIYGAGQATNNITDSGNTAGTLYIQDSGGSANNGGAILFGANQGYFAAIKSLLQDGTPNTKGYLAFLTRTNTSDTSLTEKMRIDMGGNVGIGDSDPAYTLSVDGTASVSGAFYGSDIYNSTTANAANVNVGTDGRLLRSTSSLKYKKNIADLEVGSSLIYNLRPVSFNSKNPNETKRYFGLIAEEVANVIPELVYYNENNEPESVEYEKLSVLLLDQMQKQRQAINIEDLTVNMLGNVGIGKDLIVSGSLTVEGLASASNAFVYVDTEGKLHAGDAYADLAEFTPLASESYELGELVSVRAATDEEKQQGLTNESFIGVKSTISYDQNLIGVISYPEIPALGTKLNDNYWPIVLVGRVPVKVSIENGPIEVGDYLTSSNAPGVAMRATQAGPIIGKALESFNAPDTNAFGKIMVMINLGWYSGQTTALDSNGSIADKVTIDHSAALPSFNFIENLTSGLKALGVNIKDGVIEAAKLIADEVKTRILRIAVEKDKDNTIGSATIPAQQIEFRVNNSLVEANSKIFISFTTDAGGRTWYISEKVPGVGFTIHLSDVTPEPLTFDYWIVLVEGQDSTNTTTTDTTTTTGGSNYCGDGIVYAGEECDDGNLIDGDGCSATCMVEQETGGSEQETTEPPANESEEQPVVETQPESQTTEEITPPAEEPIIKESTLPTEETII